MLTVSTRAGLIAGVAVATLASSALAQEQMFSLRNPTSPILSERDPVTGGEISAIFITGHEAIFSGMDFDADGNLYMIDGFNDPLSDRLFLLDETTGIGMVVGDTGENWNFRSLAYDATTDTLYTMRDNALYTTDRGTGAVTLVGNLSAPNMDQLTGFAIDADGVGWATDIDAASLFRIDLATAGAEFIGNATSPGVRNWFNDLAFNAEGTLHAAREQGGGVFTIDTSTGAATLKFASATFRSIAFTRVATSCRADLDGDGELTIFDFLEFQNLFDSGDLTADFDGDGSLTIFDFLAFQNEFDAGCE